MFTAGLMIPNPGFTIDPYTRVRSYSLGCSGDVTNGLIQGPNNLTIYALRGLFGPPAFGYRGLIPSGEQVDLALTNGQELDPVQLDAGKLTVGGQTVLLSSRGTKEVHWILQIETHPQDQITASMPAEECLLLAAASEDEWERVALVDTRSGRVIGRYTNIPKIYKLKHGS